MVKKDSSLGISVQSKKRALIKFKMTFGEVFSEFLNLIIRFDVMLCPRFVKSF